MSVMISRSVLPRYAPEDYPLLRSVTDPRIANLPVEDLEAELLRQGIRAEATQGFLCDAGNTFASALPAIAGLVGGGGSPAAAPPAAPGANGTNPSGMLLGLVQRPEVIQGLMSMALGPAGRKDSPVGNTTVPARAFANLLSVLGSKAFGQAEPLAEPSESLPEYLYREGKLVADPAERSQRAAVLLERIGKAAIPAARPIGVRRVLSEVNEYYDEPDAMVTSDFDGA